MQSKLKSRFTSEPSKTGEQARLYPRREGNIAKPGVVGATASCKLQAQDVASQSGAFGIIPGNLHTPLKQRMVLLKTAQPGANALLDYLQAPAAKAVLAKYGFSV